MGFRSDSVSRILNWNIRNMVVSGLEGLKSRV